MYDSAKILVLSYAGQNSIRRRSS